MKVVDWSLRRLRLSSKPSQTRTVAKEFRREIRVQVDTQGRWGSSLWFKALTKSERAEKKKASSVGSFSDQHRDPR